MRFEIWTLALLLTACGDKVGDDTGTAGDDTGSSGGGGELDSVWDSHDEEYCEGQEYGDTVPGATAYFLGEMTKGSDGKWEGTEYMVLYATDLWEAQPDPYTGRDCQVAWTVSLEETDANACAVCDFGLAGGATIDMSQTTCTGDLSALYEGDENLQLAYDVDDNGSEATFYFASSGSYLGTGSSNGGTAMNWLSEPLCQWY